MNVSIDVLCGMFLACLLLCFFAGYFLGRSTEQTKRLDDVEGWEDETMRWREHAWPVIEQLSKVAIRKETNDNTNDSTT